MSQNLIQNEQVLSKQNTQQQQTNSQLEKLKLLKAQSTPSDPINMQSQAIISSSDNQDDEIQVIPQQLNTCEDIQNAENIVQNEKETAVGQESQKSKLSQSEKLQNLKTLISSQSNTNHDQESSFTFDWVYSNNETKTTVYMQQFLENKTLQFQDYVQLDIVQFAPKDSGNNLGVANVAIDMESRLLQYGDIELNKNISRQHGGQDFNYYDADDSFIDDQEIDKNLKSMEIINAEYFDYFYFQGNQIELSLSDHFQQRIQCLSYRNVSYEEFANLKKQKRQNPPTKKRNPSKSKSVGQGDLQSKIEESQNLQKSIIDENDDDDQIEKLAKAQSLLSQKNIVDSDQQDITKPTLVDSSSTNDTIPSSMNSGKNTNNNKNQQNPSEFSIDQNSQKSTSNKDFLSQSQPQIQVNDKPRSPSINPKKSVSQIVPSSSSEQKNIQQKIKGVQQRKRQDFSPEDNGIKQTVQSILKQDKSKKDGQKSLDIPKTGKSSIQQSASQNNIK